MTTLLHALTRDYFEAGVVVVGDLSEQIVRELERRAAGGDVEAAALSAECLRHGVQGRIKPLLKGLRAEITVKSGNVVPIPQRWGIHRDGRWQQVRLWDMDYATLATLVNQESKRLKVQAQTLAALKAVLATYEEHRELPTAGDAMRAEGIDPDSLTIWSDEA